MIFTEYYATRNDGARLFKTYSDANVKILQVDTGLQYDEAIDIEGSVHTYEETEVPIEYGYLQPQEALDTILGEEV